MIVPAVIFWAVIASALSIVKALRRDVPPIFPERVISPPPEPALSSKELGPSIVFEKVMFVEFAEVLITVGLVKDAAPAKERLPPAETLPPSATAPLPVWLNAPLAVTAAVAAKLKVPELAIEIGPDADVFMVLLMAKAVPVRWIPLKVFVSTAPLNAVVPVPAT